MRSPPATRLGQGIERLSLYGFIDSQKATYTIGLLCRTLNVPQSSYFDWHSHGRRIAETREHERVELVSKITTIHADSDATYGADKVHAQLRRDGVVVALRTVAETMSDAGIAGLSGRKPSTTTTRRDRLAAPFPDLVNRNFAPLLPDRTWYGDITYIYVESRFWYLATVIDACTKEVLGWSIADHMRTELVADALHGAVRRRGGRIPPGVIFHSDRGCQYTSTEFGVACATYKIRQSMGRRGVCYDNAGAESFFSILKRELVDRYRWESVNHLKYDLFCCIEL